MKNLDVQMGSQNRHILLLLDNFSGHYISYKARNIQVEFFEPNMTSFIQPCNAGIIWCFKAHYWQTFCIQALDQEEAGERNIYKIDLLEAMLMARKAWDKVTQDTIAHCWNHTKIILVIAQTATPSLPTSDTQTATDSAPKSPQHDIKVGRSSLNLQHQIWDCCKQRQS